MVSREVKHLISLEKTFEDLKTKINIADHYDLLMLMRKVNLLKYKNGVRKIKFNMVFDEFSFCMHVENKFDNIVSCTSVSKMRRFLAVSSRQGPLFIFSLANLTLVQKFSDVI